VNAVLINPDFADILTPPLVKEGFDVITIPRCETVHTSLGGHVDLSMSLVNNTLVVRPDIDEDFINRVSNYCKVVKGETIPQNFYPRDIGYNALIGDFYYIHNTKYTDSILESILTGNKLKALHINQGYSRCSILPLPDHSIITSDAKCTDCCTSHGIDSLFITSGNIDLPGFQYGFIGGAGGTFKDCVYLSGRLDNHPDKFEIEQFIAAKDLNLKILTDETIFDSGSLFFL
jgi:hypothetical protein